MALFGPKVRGRVALSSLVLATACVDQRSEDALSAGGLGPEMDGTNGSLSAGSAGDDDAPRLDVGGSGGDPGACGGPDDPPCNCSVPDHTACDGPSSDPLQALGLNCPGELGVAATVLGSAEAIAVRSGFGPTATWDPKEGSVFAVISSGHVADLDKPTPDGDAQFGHDNPTHCNDDLGPQWNVGELPSPLDPTRVGAVDCEQDPSLVGTGDCSNTLQEQWDAGGAGGGCEINGVPCCEFNNEPCDGYANDYTELRLEAAVPSDVISFSYDLAFFTVEWPFYYGSQYNDFYVGWLESENWTGNISFDDAGSPISLNAAFFDYLDNEGNLPELAGTCMRYHGGTKWLRTTAGVVPGETITVVFAIFDLSDSVLDSYVFLDNWQWGCDPTKVPETVPEG